MEWDINLESGIPVIDHEHKELFRQLSMLLDKNQQNRIAEMLDFLGEYVVRHFAHEQVMHNAHEYPKAAEHKAAHLAFIEKFNALEEQFAAEGNSLEMLQKVVAAVDAWLKRHIMGEDKEFAEYYKKRQKKNALFC